MLTKGQRQRHLAELIRHQPVPSQAALLDRLRTTGVEVTQATLSRDLHEIGAYKGPDGYVIPDNGHATSAPDEQAFARTLKRELRWIDHTDCFVVIGTDPGHANALAAELDRARLPEVLSTLAGDDTVLVIVRRNHRPGVLKKRLRALAT